MPSRRLLLISALATVSALSGCRDGKIVTYRIAKETPPAAAVNAQSADPHAGLGIPPVNAMPAPSGQSAPASPAPSMPDAQATMANTAVPTATGGDLAWTVPAGWQSRPASAMRKATLILPGATAGEQAELAVTAFPGNVGGNLANLNRWRQQLQLAPIAASELDAALAHIHVGDLHIDVAELLGPASDGKPAQRVLGAIVPFNGATWFFKLTGPDALVAAKKPEFLAFLQTLQPAR